MYKVKETIIMSFMSFKDANKYRDAFQIIDKRWNVQLYSPLHAINHFLNPEFFYDNSQIEFDGEVVRGLYEVINKLEGDLEMEKIIMRELLSYTMGAGMFETPIVVSM